MIRKSVFLLCLAVSIVFAQAPKNIIIMIGDGMGIAQVTSGRTHKGSLTLDRFKTVGLLLTHAAGKDYITDSAAGATALSSGVKTYNGAVGVDVDKTAVLNTFEQAKKKGKKTGVVVACSITHATPACFLAHVPQRSMELEIAEQIAQGSTDVLLGSGWGWFLSKDAGGRRMDGKDLVAVMKERGYRYLANETDFSNWNPSGSEKVLGLFAENQPGPAQERKPGLREMTVKALASLASDKGFVLMVEGSQIDWAGHDNKSDQVALEMSDFDDAIGEALNFASKHPETLIVVTADHETGGYSLVGGSLQDKTVVGKFTTGGHSGAMVPLFATGPGSQLFSGIMQNSDVGKLVIQLLQ